MMDLKVWEIKQCAQSYQSERELQCKTSAFGSIAPTLFSMPLALDASQDIVLVILIATVASVHSALLLIACISQHFASHPSPVVHIHKNWPSQSQRLRPSCCRRPMMLFPKRAPSLFATNFASTYLNLNQPHCPATNPSEVKKFM